MENGVGERGPGGKGAGGGGRGEKDLFDDPKYVSASWVQETVTKAQVGLFTGMYM